MWTTSNSLAEAHPWLAAGMLFGALALAGPSAAAAQRAPDAPRPARDTLPLARRDFPAIQWLRRSVELRELRLARVRSDTMLERLAGPVRLQQAPGLIALIVETADSIPVVSRNAALEVYLGDARAGDTWVVLPRRLIAFVADIALLRPRTAVTAAWTGDEAETRSRRPLTLTEQHLQQIH